MFTVKFMHQNQRKLKLQQSKRQKVQDAQDVVVQFLLLKKCCRKDVNGIVNVFIVMNAQKHWTRETLAMVLTRKFIVKHVMEENGDHMVMDSLVEMVFSKPTSRRKNL